MFVVLHRVLADGDLSVRIRRAVGPVTNGDLARSGLRSRWCPWGAPRERGHDCANCKCTDAPSVAGNHVTSGRSAMIGLTVVGHADLVSKRRRPGCAATPPPDSMNCNNFIGRPAFGSLSGDFLPPTMIRMDYYRWSSAGWAGSALQPAWSPCEAPQRQPHEQHEQTENRNRPRIVARARQLYGAAGASAAT